MNDILIKIKRLGKVRDSELRMRPFMLFSGDSGLGKSYVAAMCQYFCAVLADAHFFDIFFKEQGVDYNSLATNFHNQGTALRVVKHDLEIWMAKDAVRYVAYIIGNDDLNGEMEVVLPDTVPDELLFTYKEDISGLVGAEDVSTILGLGDVGMRVSQQADFDVSPFAVLLCAGLSKYLYNDVFSIKGIAMLPPSRGALMTEDCKPVTGMYREFLSLLSQLKTSMKEPDKTNENLKKMLNAVMEGEVIYEDQRYYYVTNDGDKMPLSAAASSVRELAIVQRMADKSDLSRRVIWFEEPEAHLHPTKQRMMADVLAAMCSIGTRLIVTTHSTYFITRLNELIKYSQLEASARSNRVRLESLRGKLNVQTTLPAEKVAAYLFKEREDGKTEIVEQNLLSDGIMFEAFLNATNENIDNRNLLWEAENDELGE